MNNRTKGCEFDTFLDRDFLTIDLKNFLPLMDRHVLTHLVAAQASVNPRFQHPAPVLGSFFKDLAHAVVHTILAPLNSQHMRPNLPPRVFTGEFWHAHFNYAALRTDPALAAIGSMDGLFFFFALCCLGKIPGGAPFSQLHKGGKQSREDRP